MDFNINEKTYNEIAAIIHSDNSPVGIDAKKTHILILNALSRLNEKMDRLEERVNEINSK